MRYYRNPDVLWREEDEPRDEALAGLERGEDVEDVGTALLFDDSSILSINVLGTEVWKLCDGRTLEEIVAALGEEFEVESEVLAEDVSAFLAELAQKGFVRHAE
ncbi:GeoRSP system PqqD family peptide chaperone [Geomonas sp. RF6]|uniref:GeoRSP system PqqD family peptide chaperone n=1 Tax=Geomonas sp. RF6 TaxID=2897342 RepID=UPI001E5AC491|nr:GeoRSP system PqqD family peptide chaperone [Geomonas sp. RF6]UFS70314.1 GeoRSP system PqqD family peptide chaperone [Geomonas sp. RF6]